MSLNDVKEFFLTVGTTHRQSQHVSHIRDGSPYPSDVPVAGEKGIGRLSAMRLGKRLHLDTWQVDGSEQVQLDVNWGWFFDNPDADPEEYVLEPAEVARTMPMDKSGTRLVITEITSAWDFDKVTSLGSKQLSKFIDPFSAKAPRRLVVTWNSQRIDLNALAKTYLQAAHNGMIGEARVNDDGVLSLVVDYWFNNIDGGNEKIDLHRVYTAADFPGISDRDLAGIGPFTFRLYHYNRRNLRTIPGHSTRSEFKEWLDNWCGGLMLYRDGLRVLPYGRYPDDDWLQLDHARYEARDSESIESRSSAACGLADLAILSCSIKLIARDSKTTLHHWPSGTCCIASLILASCLSTERKLRHSRGPILKTWFPDSSRPSNPFRDPWMNSLQQSSGTIARE